MPLNATSNMALFDSAGSGLAAMGTGIGCLITIIVFFSTFLIIFLLFKNFRRAIYGAIIDGAILLTYFFSRDMGTSFQEGNKEPFWWFVKIGSFLIASVITGIIIEKLPFVKRIEKKLGVS